MPGSIVTGWSSDQMREMTGGSYWASPRPWPQLLAAAWSSSSYPQISAAGHFAATSAVVTPGRVASMESHSHVWASS